VIIIDNLICEHRYMRGCRRRSRAQSYWYLVPYAAHRWVQRMIQPQLRIQRTVALYQSVVRYHTLPPQQISRQQKLTRPCRINHINRLTVKSGTTAGLLAQSARCCIGCAGSTSCACTLRADPYRRWRNLLP